MAIYDPRIELTEADREALHLLAALVLAQAGNENSNIAPDAAPLSISQAEHLLSLLEDLFSSRRFVEGSYFVEGIANGDGWHDDGLREIYLSSRKRLGHSRVASTYAWNEFVVRSGFSTSQNAWLWPRAGGARTVPMDFDHFMKMEQRLAEAAGLHPRIVALIVAFLEAKASQIGEVRDHKIPLQKGAIQSKAKQFTSELRRATEGKEHTHLSRRKVIAITTLVLDVGALFITRDWTATGTISMIGSALPDLVNDS